MSSKKKTMPVILAIAIIAVAGAGYYFYQNQQGGSTGAETATQAAPTPMDQESASVETAAGTEEATAQLNGEQLQVVPGNPVVARVDGKDITRVDVYRFIQTMPPNVQQMPATSVYPMAMEQVINTRIVQNKAEAADVTESEEFAREMEMARQQIARNVFLQQEVNKKVTEDKVKKKFDEIVKDIPDVEERRARHILLETEEAAKEVVKQLKDGADFAEVAKEKSVGPTAARGGDLGYFAQSEMVPEFANAAFGMEKNSTLETPVQTQFGWHVIQVLDIRERPRPEFEQAKAAIEAEVRREEMAKMLEKWREDAKIEQFDINGNPLREGANATGLIPPQPETATN